MPLYYNIYYVYIMYLNLDGASREMTREASDWIVHPASFSHFQRNQTKDQIAADNKTTVSAIRMQMASSMTSCGPWVRSALPAITFCERLLLLRSYLTQDATLHDFGTRRCRINVFVVFYSLLEAAAARFDQTFLKSSAHER